MTYSIRIERILPIFAATLFLLSTSSPALFAQEVLFKFDPGHSRVEFTLGDILHTVHGAFRVKSGFVKFDKRTGDAQGLVVVDAASGDSGSEGRDSRMHKDILESQRYPEITFVPQHVRGQIADRQESHLQIDGLLTLHGVQHPITVDATIDPKGDQLDATTKFDVPYVKWGLKNPSTFILRVSTTVNIDIRGAGKLTENSGH